MTSPAIFAQLLDMLDVAMRENADLGLGFTLTYPTFVEVIGRTALFIEETKHVRLASNKLTVPEFRALKTLLAQCPLVVRPSRG